WICPSCHACTSCCAKRVKQKIIGIAKSQLEGILGGCNQHGESCSEKCGQSDSSVKQINKYPKGTKKAKFPLDPNTCVNKLAAPQRYLRAPGQILYASAFRPRYADGENVLN